MSLDVTAAAAEPEIDGAHRAHPLLKRAYADAMGHLLLAAEETVLVDAASLAKQDQSINLTSIVNALKYGAAWVTSGTEHRGAAGISRDGLREAHDLLKQATAYLLVVAAYSYARRGFVDLRVEGRDLLTKLPDDEDTRFDAYDLLVMPSVASSHAGKLPAMDRLHYLLDRYLQRGFAFDAIPISRDVLAVATEISSAYYDTNYQMPDTSAFATFTLSDFRRVTNAIRGALGAWQLLNQRAAMLEPTHNPAQLYVVNRRNLLDAIKQVTGIPQRRVERIVELLSYGSTEAKIADPALQPLIELLPGTIALSSPLVTGGSPERNLLALINAIPAEKSHYDSLKNRKEHWMRERLECRRPAKYVSWHGRIPGRADLPDVDYALIDARSGCILLLELKWFIAPAEPREVAERDVELKKGVAQTTKLLRAMEEGATAEQAIGFKPQRIAAAVLSANSIGSARAQDGKIPIVNEEHFLRKLEEADELSIVIDWLESRAYLPAPDVHFRYHRYEVTYFGWTLHWYGLEALHKTTDLLPL